MNNIEHKQDEIDHAKVREYADNLIRNHKGYNPNILGGVMEHEQAIHASIITAKELASVTAKKFYYEVIQYLKLKKNLV